MLDLACWKFLCCRGYTDQKSWIALCIVFLQLVLATQGNTQCKDQSLCSFMASEGECENDPDYMLQECPKACKNPCLCPGISEDTACDCLSKAKSGYCKDPAAMSDCQTTCSQVQHESCPLLPVPDDPHARLSTWDNNYLVTVTEDCIQGYTPVEPDNQGKKTCSAGSKWVDDPYNGAPVECTPVDCGQPPSSPNAFSGPISTEFGSKADYACAKGYDHVQGQTTLTCNASGLWEGDVIVCKKMDCGPPQPSPNASVKVTSASPGGTATYTCELGFNHTQGDTSLTCGSSGVWQGKLIVCTAINCGTPPSPVNSQVIVKDTTYGQTANYTCLDGFTGVQGQAVLTCNSSGVWDPGPPVCERVTCGQPPVVPHADVAVNSTKYGDTTNYTCSQGYTYAQGNASLVCGSKGIWEGVLMTCAKVTCGQPPSGTHADVTVTTTSYGDTANYTCRQGYAYDKGDRILTCGSNGTWDGVLISCRKVTCGQPPTVPSVEVTVANTSYGDTANYTCRQGYAYEKGDRILTCGPNGTWEGAFISCSKITCGQSPSRPNTDITVTNTSYGDTANYICRQGYAYDKGDRVLTCGSNGTWEGVLVSCTKITCGQPPFSPNTDVAVTNTSYNDTANYTCRRGYAYDTGDKVLTCGSNGTWEGVLLSCTKVTCGQPPAVPNADVTATNSSYNDTARYACKQGYAYDKGDRVLTCGSNGTWEGIVISCKKITCGQPPSVQNTDVTAPNATYGGTANYTCRQGYAYGKGDRILTCGSNGTWEGVWVSCTIIDCGKLPTPQEANVLMSGTSYGQSANYSCQTGYMATTGNRTRLCSASGQWTGTALVCTAIDCGAPPNLTYTHVQVSGTTYNQTATYSCQIGYQYQQGESSLVCGLSGRWTGNALKCKIINCGSPPRGQNLAMSYTNTTYNQRVNYACTARYKYSSGDKYLTCNQTGSWSGELMTCVDKDCGVPEAHNSSSVKFPATTCGSQAVYTCNVGLERSDGDLTRTCQENETWSGSPVTCSPFVCGPAPIFEGARQFTLPGEGHLQYQDKSHYECEPEEESREGLQWVLECGPNKVWVGDPPQCGANSPHKTPTSPHTTVNTPGAWAIGIAIFAIIMTAIVLCLVLDCGACRKRFRCLRKNMTSFKKSVANSLPSIHSTTKWTPGAVNEGRLIPSSPTVIHSISPSPSMASFHPKDSGTSLAKTNNLQSEYLTAFSSQSQLFPPSVSPMTPRSSLSIPKSPSGITLSSLSEATLRNPMPDVGS